MAHRIEESTITSGEICNREKGRVRVRLELVDGSVVNAELEGNPYRDLAGRTLIFGHPTPCLEAVARETLIPEQDGAAGEITAARKVQVPTIPVEQFREYYETKKEIPTTWKNSLYLEWFSRQHGRVVLEGSELELSLSEPAWVMTDEEEKEAREAAERALTRFLDEVCDLVKEREPVVEEDRPMDEHEWEKFMRKSDKINDRYGELIEKFGMEQHDRIEEYMGWGVDEEEEGEEGEEGDGQWRDDPGFPDLSEEDLEDLPERRPHPLNQRAKELQQSITYPKEEPESPMAEFYWAFATVAAKMAGALSGLELDDDPDAGFVIANLKRCLVPLDAAVEKAQAASPEHVQPLLELRQEIIDLQNEMRKRL